RFRDQCNACRKCSIWRPHWPADPNTGELVDLWGTTGDSYVRRWKVWLGKEPIRFSTRRGADGHPLSEAIFQHRDHIFPRHERRGTACSSAPRIHSANYTQLRTTAAFPM